MYEFRCTIWSRLKTIGSFIDLYQDECQGHVIPLRLKKKRFMFPVTYPKWKFRVGRHQPFFLKNLFFLPEAKKHIKWRKCWFFGHFVPKLTSKFAHFYFCSWKSTSNFAIFYFSNKFVPKLSSNFAIFYFCSQKSKKKVRVGGF